MHIEPRKVDSGSGGPPIFHRAMALVKSVTEVAPLFAGDKGQRARLKFRLSERGKFIHRNRYSRRSVICVLSGEQHWLLIDSDGTPADAMLGRFVAGSMIFLAGFRTVEMAVARGGQEGADFVHILDPGASSTPDDTSTATAPLVFTASARFSAVSPPANSHGRAKV